MLAGVETILIELNSPLDGETITRHLLARGLWATTGKTPAQTVIARLAVDIKKNGRHSKFQRIAPGMFALRIWGMPEFAGKSIGAKPKPTAVPKEPAKAMSFSDAAEAVLERNGNHKPMHYRDITQMALEQGLIRTQGQTPAATLYAQIVTEIARHTRRGQAPRFARHGKGYIGLTKWMGSGLAFQIEQHNRQVRSRLRTRILSNSAQAFEELLGKLLVALGFEDVSVTGRSGDGGIDLRGTLVVGDVIRTRMAVQAKRWRKNVQAPIVQQVRGSLGAHEQGLIITASDFSVGARREAERADAVPVALMNGEQLVALLAEHTIGVHRATHDLIELGEVEDDHSLT